MPLLEGVRAKDSKAGGHGRIPSHVHEAVEMILSVIGVERRHPRCKVVDRNHGAHCCGHVGHVIGGDVVE
jgi:hypothetical protein